MAFVLVITLLTCLVGVPSIGHAQSQSMSLSGSQPAQQVSGDLPVSPVCVGYTWVDDPSYYLSITVSMTAGGEWIATGSQWGLGNAYLSLTGSTTVGKSSKTINCQLSSSWGGFDSLQYTYPGRVPTTLTTQLDAFTYVAFGHYERLRFYAVSENYGYRYGYSGAPVSESFSTSSNGCNLTVQTSPSSLNGDGEFEDRYTTFGQPIPACSVVPSCVTNTTQTLTIDGAASFSHSVDWSCTNVAVAR